MTRSSFTPAPSLVGMPWKARTMERAGMHGSLRKRRSEILADAVQFLHDLGRQRHIGGGEIFPQMRQR